MSHAMCYVKLVEAYKPDSVSSVKPGDNHLSSPDVIVGVERFPCTFSKSAGFKLAPGRACQVSAVTSRLQPQLNISRE